MTTQFRTYDELLSTHFCTVQAEKQRADVQMECDNMNMKLEESNGRLSCVEHENRQTKEEVSKLLQEVGRGDQNFNRLSYVYTF